MKTKIEIKTVFGKHLFEFEKENNCVKDTLIEAIGKRVDLQEVDLRGAILQGANLQGAILRGAGLWRADLRGANLQEANLRGAILQGADLRGANLQGANLQGANLQEADLWRADLRGANLQGVDLQEVDLRGANLQEANLRGADLREADLRGAGLWGANLQKIYNQNTILPDGELIVWKKLNNDLIAKLLIPVEAKRVNAIGSRKCRFEFAKVIAIYNWDKEVNTGYGIYDRDFIYEKGGIVKPDKFDDSPLVECSNGIHAFITRQEAEDYNN